MMYTLFNRCGEFVSLIAGKLYDQDIPAGYDFVAGNYSEGYTLINGILEHKIAVSLSVSRSSMCADGVDYSTISAEPGTTAIINGQYIELSEPLEIATDMPGTIEILLRHPLRLDTMVTIEAAMP